VFYSGRPIIELPGQQAGVGQFFADEPDAVLITTYGQLHELETVLPPEVTILARTKRFLKNDELVLLGRVPSRFASAPSIEGR
jgi:hypothetical protein